MPHFRTLLRATAGILVLLSLASCDRVGASADNKVKIAYIGLTCEAPLFSAYENGFFKDEGLEAEMVKVDWSTMREGLGAGKCDATHTLIASTPGALRRRSGSRP